MFLVVLSSYFERFVSYSYLLLDLDLEWIINGPYKELNYNDTFNFHVSMRDKIIVSSVQETNQTMRISNCLDIFRLVTQTFNLDQPQIN